MDPVPDPVPPLIEPDAEAAETPVTGRVRRWRSARVASWSRRLGLFVAGVVAAFIALALYGAVFPPAPPLSREDVTRSITQALASQTPGPALSEGAYAAIQPSLVVVEAAAGPGGGPGSSAAPGASQLPPAGSGPSPSTGPGLESLGSGVIIDDAGDIMTSLHVVANAGAITVTFADGSRSAAQVTTRETAEDIAVLRPEQPPASFKPAILGDPGGLRIGSEAYVVGNPFGLAGSMSAGIVSGLDRTFQEPNGGPLLKGLIQVDAAVNPGNSGGPLVDRNGRVLGIVTGLVNPTKQDVFVGIGLAVPIDTAGGPAGLPQY